MSTEDSTVHWEGVYQEKSTDELTWYQERPSTSLELIEHAVDRAGLEEAVRVVDVGAGASTLEDYLVAESRYEVTAIDLAESALERTRERIGPEAAKAIRWVVADVTEPLEEVGPFDIWHDRAVFHFLTDPVDRERYLTNLKKMVPRGQHAIISTFSLEGPERCSGLPVRQYSPERLSKELGEEWELIESRREDHPTPWGGTQNFIYGLFERV